MLFGANAGAETLGVTAPPVAGVPGLNCISGVPLGQTSADPSTPFTPPIEGGIITRWQTYTAGDAADSALEFMVLRPLAGSYNVVGTDTETLPQHLPTDNVASFTLASPIPVQAGDTLALSTSAADVCAFSVSGAAGLNDSAFAGIPGMGVGYAPTPLGDDIVLNVAATLALPADLGVTSVTQPSAEFAGGAAVLRSVVTDAGPGSGPVTTVIDHVPNGLQVLGAAADLGPCAVSGQTVTCTLSGLTAGQSSTVEVVVAAPTAGSYANDVTVSGSEIVDTNSANNEAHATLVVNTPPSAGSSSTGSSNSGSSSSGSSSSSSGSPTIAPQSTVAQHCLVPSLRKTPMAVARTVLTELGCTVKVTRQHAKVGKGLVIATKGKAGSYPLKQRITLIVSSGPKAKKHKKH
jgi:hypothetical protein